MENVNKFSPFSPGSLVQFKPGSPYHRHYGNNTYKVLRLTSSFNSAEPEYLLACITGERITTSHRYLYPVDSTFADRAFFEPHYIARKSCDLLFNEGDIFLEDNNSFIYNDGLKVILDLKTFNNLFTKIEKR